MSRTSERLPVLETRSETGDSRTSRSHGALLVGAFSLTLFISAFLLFLVQPMFAKMILPLLGGSPAVWNTAMLFFQASLLAGYAYAHYSIARLGVRRQALLHLGLLAAGLMALPIAVPAGWLPPVTENPVPWLLLVLAVSVGLPFFLVSSTAPLLQKWFAATAHRSAGDPYFLYRASNVGSMLALVGYPTVVEPHLRLATQGRLWAAGYVVLTGLIAVCAAALWRTGAASGAFAAPSAAETTPASGAFGLSVMRRARWIALAFVPSSLMLGVTAHITTDIAAVPLFWIAPLALYLLTFVLVFSPRPRERRHRFMVRALPFVVLLIVATRFVALPGLSALLVPLHLTGFFVAAMVCHGELARDRPHTRHLTAFYLLLAVGGALGGLFNAVVAPLLFNTFIEYPLAIVLACLLLPRRDRVPRPGARWLDLALPAALGLLVVAGAAALRFLGSHRVAVFAVALIPVVLCFFFRARPLRFGLGVAALMTVPALFLAGGTGLVYVERTFFGVHKVVPDTAGEYHWLVHGTTIHGVQSLDPERRREPLSYYRPGGAVAQVFESVEKRRDARVGVLGLGTGTIACYARPGQSWTFLEIDPAVERIARDPRLFTYLRDCAPEAEVILGDGRLSLAQVPGRLDVLVLDAFTSDAVPIHLLTKEAFDTYLEKLTDDGVLLINITNRYVDLRGVLSRHAAELGLVAWGNEDPELSAAEKRAGMTSSAWVVMSPKPAAVGTLSDSDGWTPLELDEAAPRWSDDFSNLLGVLRRL